MAGSAQQLDRVRKEIERLSRGTDQAATIAKAIVLLNDTLHEHDQRLRQIEQRLATLGGPSV
jgi:uncharacterized coiled-coil DUF342 family protein